MLSETVSRYIDPGISAECTRSRSPFTLVSLGGFLDQPPVDLSGLIELGQDMLFFGGRGPPRPLLDFDAELVDPPEKVFGGGAVPDLFISYIDSHGVGSRQGKSWFE